MKKPEEQQSEESGIKFPPIGIMASGTRKESDSMGEIDVPADHYWGAQTQRSLIHFSIGHDKMPKEVYHAYGYVKKAAAMVNYRNGSLKCLLNGRYAPAHCRNQRNGYDRSSEKRI